MSTNRNPGEPGLLYLVATPIGNLEDMTHRAVRVLKEADLIAAEDTRHSRRLLSHYGIDTALISYHEHNEQEREATLLDKLQRGQSIALISDAGTPCIADPGYRLVQACCQAGIAVVPVPGPSALVAALSASGLPTDRFVFEGYLPARAKARTELLARLATETRTLIFYEAPHRLEKSLADIVHVLGGERGLVVARELTKLHEELYRGTAQEAYDHFCQQPARGELVLMLAPVEVGPQISVQEALRDLFAAAELSRREIVKLVAREYGLPQSEVYRESLKFGQG